MSPGRGNRGEKRWMGEGFSTWTHTSEPEHTLCPCSINTICHSPDFFCKFWLNVPPRNLLHFSFSEVSILAWIRVCESCGGIIPQMTIEKHRWCNLFTTKCKFVTVWFLESLSSTSTFVSRSGVWWLCRSECRSRLPRNQRQREVAAVHQWKWHLWDAHVSCRPIRAPPV